MLLLLFLKLTVKNSISLKEFACSFVILICFREYTLCAL